MTQLKVDISNAQDFVSKTSLDFYYKEVILNHKVLLEKTGKGNDFLGWLDLPFADNTELVSRMKEDAEKIASWSHLLVVIGIGGSYLGSRAVIEALSNPFSALLPLRKNPYVVYAGENLCEDYHHDLLNLLDRFDYSVLVISKSGTTTEPAVAFRLVKDHLEQKYGREKVSERIIAITDAKDGELKKMAGEEKFRTYDIPDDVGGRFSVLTHVVLLPIAAAGFDIDQLLSGAREMRNLLFSKTNPDENPAITYAAIRNALYHEGKVIELLVNFKPRLIYFTEWWKQLYGESEGKEEKGIFPAGVSFTTDLHSMGQYIQQGKRNLFETVLSVDNLSNDLKVPEVGVNPGKGKDFLSGKTLFEINRMAEEGTRLAHVDGGVPNIRISLPAINENTLGQLIYFFEFACALSGYTLGVNPFDQPGVEEYKDNMFALLGKPGKDKKGEELRKRLRK
jgi:glucose-6-phosphate isomerase